MIRKAVVGLCLLVSPLTALHLLAQLNLPYTRDSIDIEQGVAGTMNFTPMFKLINEVFDDENRPLRSVVYRIEEAGNRIPTQRQQFSYDGNNNVRLLLLENWDNTNQAWVPFKREERNYNGPQLLTHLRQMATASTLINDRRWLYQYNSNGQETEKLIQDWDAGSSSWENVSRKQTTYTTENQIESQLLQRYIDGSWQNSRLRSWLWEANQLQPSSTLMQSWSTESAAWDNELRKTYSMGANGLWSGVTTEVWDAAAGVWVNEVRETYTLDESINASYFQGERWQEEEWQRSLRSLYSYTPDRNTGLVQEWNTTTNQYQNFLRFRSSFDVEGLPTERIGMQRWNASIPNWENDQFTRRITYYWSDTSTGLTSLESPKPCQLANPYYAGAMVNCDWEYNTSALRWELINLYGQPISQEKVIGNTFQLPSYVPAGLYLLRIFDGQRLRQVEKIIIPQ